MLKLKKKVAFELFVNTFGPWNTWDRGVNLAYGLIRGVEYSRMEKYANDNPYGFNIAFNLWKIGAWEEFPYINGKYSAPHECRVAVKKLVIWVRKPVKIKRASLASEAAQ